MFQLLHFPGTPLLSVFPHYNSSLGYRQMGPLKDVLPIAQQGVLAPLPGGPQLNFF